MGRETVLDDKYILDGDDWIEKILGNTNFPPEGDVRVIEGLLYYAVHERIDDYDPCIGTVPKILRWKRVPS